MFPKRTERLSLRPLVESDRGEFVRVWDISAKHFGPWTPRHDPSQTLDGLFDKWLSRSVAGQRTGLEYRLVATMPPAPAQTDRAVGYFHLFQVERGAFFNATASWMVSADATRQGYGVEGVNALLTLAFATQPDGLGLHRVQAAIIPDNTASVSLAGKCGFRREGLAKDYLRINGRWQDHFLFAKLASEHPGTR